MNMRNFGIVEGRLTKDPVVFTNKDGSRKVMLTVAAKDNYKDKNGERTTQFVALEGFVNKDKKDNGVFEHMAKGDLIGAEYTVRSNNYKDKNGEDVFSQVLLISSVDLKESKSAIAARHAAGVDSDAADV